MMTMRKVLLVTYHFPPSAASGSFRLLGFVRHLPRFGWQPIVVAPPSTPWEPQDEELGRQVPPGTIVRSTPYPSAAPRVLRILAPYLMWLPRAWRACRAAARELRPDVVLTSGPPHLVHWLGLSMKRRHGVPWVADFRDPWVTSGYSQDRGMYGFVSRYSERKVFDRADAILANAPNSGALLRQALPAHAHKIRTLTNGFDPEYFPSKPAPSAGPIRLVHAGELYWGRNPLPLLDAVAAWNGTPGNETRPIRVEAIGRTELPVDMQQEIASRGLAASVTMTGQLPYFAALRAMAGANILVLFDTPGRKVGVPAKLYEYLGTRRPILALADADGDTAGVLRDSGVLHRLAAPDNAAQIRQALGELIERSAEAVGPINSALERYTRAALTGELAALFEQLVSGHGASAPDTAPRRAADVVR
jgi:glycosyltransferase involved in cell wall biosynthesis